MPFLASPGDGADAASEDIYADDETIYADNE